MVLKVNSLLESTAARSTKQLGTQVEDSSMQVVQDLLIRQHTPGASPTKRKSQAVSLKRQCRLERQAKHKMINSPFSFYSTLDENSIPSRLFVLQS